LNAETTADRNDLPRVSRTLHLVAGEEKKIQLEVDIQRGYAKTSSFLTGIWVEAFRTSSDIDGQVYL